MSRSCPVCAGERTRPFWETVWGDPSQRVMACDGCGLFFLAQARSGEGQRDFDRNYDAYIAERAKAVPGGEAFAELVDESIAERFADIGERFAGSRSTLEIGAERGGFLDRLKGRVPGLTGVDACPAYHDTLRGKGYRAFSYISDVPDSERHDRICLFSLLEHIPEPVPFLRDVARRLAPDGLVVIEVPSAAEPLVSLYDIPAFKSFYFQAMHPYVYSLKALDVVLEAAGLKRTSVKYKQRYGLANHLQWLKAGVPGGSAAYEALFAGAADAAYRRALEDKGVTDTVYVVAAHRRDA